MIIKRCEYCEKETPQAYTGFSLYSIVGGYFYLIIPGLIMHKMIKRHCMKCGLTPERAQVLKTIEKGNNIPNYQAEEKYEN